MPIASTQGTCNYDRIRQSRDLRIELFPAWQRECILKTYKKAQNIHSGQAYVSGRLQLRSVSSGQCLYVREAATDRHWSEVYDKSFATSRGKTPSPTLDRKGGFRAAVLPSLPRKWFINDTRTYICPTRWLFTGKEWKAGAIAAAGDTENVGKERNELTHARRRSSKRANSKDRQLMSNADN